MIYRYKKLLILEPPKCITPEFPKHKTNPQSVFHSPTTARTLRFSLALFCQQSRNYRTINLGGRLRRAQNELAPPLCWYPPASDIAHNYVCLLPDTLATTPPYSGVLCRIQDQVPGAKSYGNYSCQVAACHRYEGNTPGMFYCGDGSVWISIVAVVCMVIIRGSVPNQNRQFVCYRICGMSLTWFIRTNNRSKTYEK